MFCVFLHYCSIRLSNIGFVIFASSILRCVYFVMFNLFGLSFQNERRARDAPTAEAGDNVEQPFQGEALAPAPRCRGRGSSGRGVVSGCICFRRDFINGFVGLILCYFDC